MFPEPGSGVERLVNDLAAQGYSFDFELTEEIADLANKMLNAVDKVGHAYLASDEHVEGTDPASKAAAMFSAAGLLTSLNLGYLHSFEDDWGEDPEPYDESQEYTFQRDQELQ